MEHLLQQQLLRVQQRQKHQADKKRTERQFEVGQSVFVKLQPYVQSSVAHRVNQKLSYRYFGPFQIIQRIGAAAYKLRMPADSSVHPVFHVSQLKLAIGSSVQVSSDIPSPPSSFQYPLKILQRHHVPNHNSDHILVHWSEWPEHLAAWEDEQALKLTFPAAPAWGQAGSQGRRNVTVPEDTGDARGKEEDGRSLVELGTGSSTSRRPVRQTKPNKRYRGPEWKTSP